MTTRTLPAAGAGLLAAGAALATGELLSGLSDRIPSLVLGVAVLFVDETPGGIVRWSIDTLGASQKGVLVAGIVVVCLLLGAVFGLVARRDRWTAAAGFAAFGLFGGWAAARGSLSSDVGAWFSAVLSTGVGIASLVAMVKPLARSVAVTPTMAALDRRRFIVAASATAAWGLFGAGVGRFLRAARNVDAARRRLAAQLGSRTGPLVPPSVEAFDSIAGISPLVTPNRTFYRIDTALMVPQVDPADWTLRVTGMVDRDVEVTFDELFAMERVEEFITLQCVSNEVGGDLVGNALWSGVPLRAVLDLAGVQSGASQIVGRSVDGWTGGFPTSVAFDGRPCLVAITMNGEPLPVEHGFPARLVIPGLYGYVSATKWLTEIELTTLEAFDGYWIPRGWAKDGPIKTGSRIDVPRRNANVVAGLVMIAGVAWAPTRSIDRVEIRIDEGEWHMAVLSGVLSAHAWVQWVYEWQASPGAHQVQVRATDGEGRTQTGAIAPPAPSGATGYHTATIHVS